MKYQTVVLLFLGLLSVGEVSAEKGFVEKQLTDPKKAA